MPISAQVYMKHPDIALTPTIQSLPNVDIKVIPDAGTDPYNDANFFLIGADDFEAVEAAMAEDPTVADFTTLITHESHQTYRITYSSNAKLISPRIVDIGAIIVNSESHRDGWLLELDMQDHAELYELSTYAEEADITLDVLELRQTSRSGEAAGLGLTDAQRETLATAYREGYYDDPREAVLEDLAGELDVSRTSVSGRLRRGSENLIESVILESENE